MIRDAEPKDGAQFVEWATKTPETGFDGRVLEYPLLQTFTVEDQDGPLIYVPWHPVMQLEGVAVRPGISGRQFIQAMDEAQPYLERVARGYRMSAMLASSTHLPTAKAYMRRGGKPVPGIALRREI